MLLSAATPEAAEQLAVATGEIKARRHEAGAGGRPPLIGFGGGVFQTHPELRRGIDGIFLAAGAEVAAAVDAAFDGAVSGGRIAI